jgi:predicted transcriptional regulator of viral defense system
MPKKRTETDRVLALAESGKLLRVKDLVAHDIHPEHLRRLHRRGLLERCSRGVYRLAGAEFTGNLGLAEVAKRVPHGVFCLLTALRFHDLGTQNPPDIWLAVKRGTRPPRIDRPQVRVFRFTGKAFTEGVEEHRIEGVMVRVTNPAKTVADCFKYRNKVGLEVALEAARDCWRSRKATGDELWKYAKVCRVANVMRPYLEAIVG